MQALGGGRGSERGIYGGAAGGGCGGVATGRDGGAGAGSWEVPPAVWRGGGGVGGPGREGASTILLGAVGRIIRDVQVVMS